MQAPISGTERLSMSDVVNNTRETAKQQEEAIKAAQKRQEEERRAIEREAQRIRRELEAEEKRKAQEAEKEAQQAEKEARERNARLRWEAIKELYPEEASGMSIRGGATADKYEQAIESVKLKNQLKTAPTQLHMIGGIATAFYCKLIMPEERGGMGVNPMGHRWSCGNQTLPQFWNTDEVKAELYPVWQELVTEYPEWFLGAPVLLKAAWGVYSVIDRFSAKAIMMEQMRNKGTSPNMPGNIPTPPSNPEVDEELANMDLDDFGDLE